MKKGGIMRSRAELTFAELQFKNKKSKWQRFKRKLRLLFVRKNHELMKKIRKLKKENENE